jgi:hypothetical protein
MSLAEFPLRDGQQLSPFPASFDDEIADGSLEYAPVSSHHLQFF